MKNRKQIQSLIFVLLKDDFKCSNGYCIRIERKCDGIDHCGNGDDESESNCSGTCPRVSLVLNDHSGNGNDKSEANC